MTAITRRGVYLPQYRIETSTIQEQWGGGTSGVGTKVVQAKDDDPITLATRLGREMLDGRSDVDAVFFATTTPLYQYGSATPMLLEALGLPEGTYTQTFTQSARAGTAALRAAGDAVSARLDSVLVLSAEAPSPEPTTDWEKTAGAGAAAAIVEQESGLERRAEESTSRPLLDEWQAPGDETLETADGRFARDIGYVEMTQRAVERTLEKADWETADIDRLVLPHPNGKFAGRLAGAIGVSDDVLATPSLGREHGNLRAASALCSLAYTEISEGDRILVAGYGTGTADGLAYRATESVEMVDLVAETTELDYLNYLEHVGQLG